MHKMSRAKRLGLDNPPSERKQTNAERIQTMSIEALAEFLSEVKYDGVYYQEGQQYPMQSAVWEDWLRSEVEE